MNFGNNGNEEIDHNVVPFGSKQSNDFANPKSLAERYFTKVGRDAYKYDMFGKEINWVSEDVAVTDDMGKVVFTQKGVRNLTFGVLLL